MDVNGTRFHLLYGKHDWDATLAESASRGPVDAHFDDTRNVLTLAPRLNVFIPRGQRPVPLQPSARRGATVDRFGNFYWISRDRRMIYRQASGARNPAVYWHQQPPSQPKRKGQFSPVAGKPFAAAELSGMAITAHHYLVVGNRTARGLFVFDLHAGGEPLLLLFPQEHAFQPFDMTPAPDGGLWILDRQHRTYWGLNRSFQLLHDPYQQSPLASPASALPAAPFQTEQGADPGAGSVAPDCESPRGFVVNAADPISIEALSDGSVLILDSPSGDGGNSVLLHYRFGKEVATPIALPDLTSFVAERAIRSVNGYDMVYLAEQKLLYIVARDGNQAFAYAFDPLDASTPAPPLEFKVTYLPMQTFGSRALIAGNGQVFYDAAKGDSGDGSRPLGDDSAVRWALLQPVDQSRYAQQATLHTPILDAKERDSTWHRLFLDACIPSEAGITIESRSADLPELLEAVPFQAEPSLYLRGRGSELPYHRSFPELEQPRAGTGTWELLFQSARGRYLQLRLTLTGNGRTTPQIRALRAYYPRFSYLKRYLPAVYQEEGDETAFLERLLANMEGITTEIEGRMVQVSTLFDARSVPPEALDWLAGWLGLMIDPLWAKLPAQGRMAVQGIHIADRRRLLIRFAPKLYARRGTPEGIRFALHLLLDPCLEQMLERFRAAAVQLDPGLHTELERLGLPYPTVVMSDHELETLLYDYLLAPGRPSKIRLVERYQTRQGRALVAGDPTQASAAPPTVAEAAHRFSVLLPEELAPEETKMVQRIVALEKPAHTLFDLRHYWDYFRVGEARLGLDTVLGEVADFRPMVLGYHYLAEGYLAPDHPFDVHERMIADRDLLGHVPL